jgi:hypothetical protein
MIRYVKDLPTAFDPETIEILGVALDAAWRQVEANKSAFKADGNTDGARNALAKHIVNMARRGERDPQCLSQAAVEQLRL